MDFSHVKRQVNRQAHLLVKHALGIVDFLTWMEENPYFLVYALIYDVSIPCDSEIKFQSFHKKKNGKIFNDWIKDLKFNPHLY